MVCRMARANRITMINNYKLLVFVPEKYSNCIREYLSDTMEKYKNTEYFKEKNKYCEMCDLTEVLIQHYLLNITMAMDKETKEIVPVNTVRRFRQFTEKELEEYFKEYKYDLKYNELSLSKGMSNQAFGVFYLPDEYEKICLPKCYVMSLEEFMDISNQDQILIINKDDDINKYEQTCIQLLVDKLRNTPYPKDMCIEEVVEDIKSQIKLYNYMNPNSKWSTYVPGGLYSNGLRNKDNDEWFAFRIKDVNIHYKDREEIAKNIWEFVIEDKDVKYGDTKEEKELAILFKKMFISDFTKKSLLSNFKDKEDFINTYSIVTSFSFINKDTKWYESFDYDCNKIIKNKEYINTFVREFNKCNENDILVCLSCSI